MERVSQATVVRHWLREELARTRGEPPAVGDLDDSEALDWLLQLKPGAAAFIWRDAPVDWYRLELTRREFRHLHVVAGPGDLGWSVLTPDGTVRAVAERFHRAGGDALAEATGVDVGLIRELVTAMPDVVLDPMVLSTRRGCVPWHVADGNHRAVALALHLLDGGTYEPPQAYLGVGANPIVVPLRERLCGHLQRLFGRSAGPAGRPWRWTARRRVSLPDTAADTGRQGGARPRTSSWWAI